MKKTNFVLLPLAALVATSVQAQETEQLDVIRITTENTGTKSKTNVVTLAEQAKSTETDMRGLLKSEPSINFGGGNGGTSQWLTIRGMGQDQVDLKVDNAYSDTQVFHHQGRFIFDPSLIKRIDVKKGTGSASAGIGATSGSIEATTIDAKDLLRDGQSIGFKLRGGVSSNKGHEQGATVYSKAGVFDALVSGNWLYEEEYKGGRGYKNLNGSKKVANSSLNQRGLLAKFGVDITENQRIVFSHRQEQYHGERALREEFDFSQSWLATAELNKQQQARGYQLSNEKAGTGNNGKPTYYVLDKEGNRVTNTDNNQPRYRITTQDTTNLEWTGKNMGFITEAKANVYRQEISRKETDAKSEARIFTKGANLNFDSAIGSSHLIKYGVNYRHQKGVPSSLQTATHNQEKTDTGVYAEGIWGFGPVTLTTGARYDHFKSTDTRGKNVSKGAFNPSVAVIWEAIDGLSFTSNLNFATRSPRMYEVALAGSRIVALDENLRPEKARNVEVGFNYDLSDMFSLDGSYFWQKVKDAHSVRNEKNIRTLYNGALLRNKGYELGAAFKYAGLTVRAGVADSKPEVYGSTADSTVFAQAIGRTWTTGISYRLEQPNLEFGWKGRFVESEEGNPSRGSAAANTKPIKRPGYGINDFYIAWKANENLNLNFAVNNAFDKNYKSHSQRTGESSLAGKGRDYRVNVSYTF